MRTKNYSVFDISDFFLFSFNIVEFHPTSHGKSMNMKLLWLQYDILTKRLTIVKYSLEFSLSYFVDLLLTVASCLIFCLLDGRNTLSNLQPCTRLQNLSAIWMESHEYDFDSHFCNYEAGNENLPLQKSTIFFLLMLIYLTVNKWCMYYYIFSATIYSCFSHSV